MFATTRRARHGSILPLDFTTGQSYNQIFVSGTPDANHLNPSGFEIFFNKSNDAAQVVNIDNVTLGPVPEPGTFAVLTLVGGLLAGSRRRIH